MLLLLPPPNIFIKADPALEKNPVELAAGASVLATGLISTAAATATTATAAVSGTETGTAFALLLLLLRGAVAVSAPSPCPCCVLPCRACLALSSFSAKVKGFSSLSFPCTPSAADTGTGTGAATVTFAVCVVSVLALVTGGVGVDDVFAAAIAVDAGVVDDLGLPSPLGPLFCGGCVVVAAVDDDGGVVVLDDFEGEVLLFRDITFTLPY